MLTEKVGQENRAPYGRGHGRLRGQEPGAWRRAALARASGTVTQKVLPTDSVLSTAIVPPIRSTRRCVIARPRPVPPYFRDTDASTCVNASKMVATRADGMPMPVSRTVHERSTIPGERGCGVLLTDTSTEPSSVNLIALPTRFTSTWR